MDSIQQQIGEELNKVYHRALQYVIAHVKLPGDPLTHPNVPAEHKQRLINAAGSRELASRLLADPQTRFLLYARAIVDWMQEEIFHHNDFAGLKGGESLDKKIQSLSDHYYQSAPVPIKANLLQNVSDALAELRRLPGFNDHVKRLIKDRAEAIWPFLTSIHGQKTTADWADLSQLVREAHELALMLYTGPYQYLFGTFQGQKFKQADMEIKNNNWPHMSLANIEQQNFKVVFTVSPRVEAKKYFTNSTLTTYTISKARVVIRAPAPGDADSPPLPTITGMYDGPADFSGSDSGSEGKGGEATGEGKADMGGEAGKAE